MFRGMVRGNAIDDDNAYDSLLPTHISEPDTPMIGSTNRHPSRNGGFEGRGRAAAVWTATAWKRPRFVMSLVATAVITFVLLPASNRATAHAALTKAGVPIPDGLPDRLHDFLDSWNLGIDDGSNDLEYIPPPEESNDVTTEFSELEMQSPHTFKPNGYMEVQPLSAFQDQPPSPHPVLILIKRAETQWARKVAKQSKNLKEAVREYRRRYSRNPPKGFDQWWAYAKANRIVLTDEYDQIHKDLLPFWALEPGDLYHRSMVMEQREETFTISVTDGKVELSGEFASLRRAKDLGDLLWRFSSHIPNVNLTFTRHDQPACQLEWFHKERMVELATMGEYFGPSEFVKESDLPFTNWANGCPPDSSLRETEAKILTDPNIGVNDTVIDAQLKKAYYSHLNPTNRTFIYDHLAAMDICQHPEIMPLHGFTTAPGTDPGPLVPLFTFAKTSIHSDILVTPLEQYSPTYIGYDPDFDKKKHNKLMWRGSTTGVDFLVENDWKASQRSRLHFMTHEKVGRRKVLVAEGEEAIKEEELLIKDLNQKMTDCAFSGVPVQCDEETCELMSKIIDFQPTMGLDDSYQYKYLMDVDGNGWSGRFHRLMSMKAPVFKSTVFPEWYGERIQPWVHYVPIKIDYSDLYDILTFFRGTPDGHGAHEHLASKIGMAGKHWARDHWRKQDMAAYMFRLTLEWARLLHRDEEGSPDFDFNFD